MAAAARRGVDALAQQVRTAPDAADLSQFGELLDPDVHSGAPDHATPSCQTRRDVLAWYARGRAAGRRARVVEEVGTHRAKNLVQLRVVDRSPAGTPDLERDRWPVLTCAGGRIVDIRGFETRDEAVTRLTPPAQQRA